MLQIAAKCLSKSKDYHCAASTYSLEFGTDTVPAYKFNQLNTY
jgi:hypothetical protein